MTPRQGQRDPAGEAMEPDPRRWLALVVLAAMQPHQVTGQDSGLGSGVQNAMQQPSWKG